MCRATPAPPPRACRAWKASNASNAATSWHARHTTFILPKYTYTYILPKLSDQLSWGLGGHIVYDELKLTGLNIYTIINLAKAQAILMFWRPPSIRICAQGGSVKMVSTMLYIFFLKKNTHTLEYMYKKTRGARLWWPKQGGYLVL